MSHIVTVKTEIRDPAALVAACIRLGLKPPVEGTVRLYEGEATGWIVHLPCWIYPVVVDIPSRQVRYDNYGGTWGDPKELDRLLQGYAVTKAVMEARRLGHSVTEQLLADGTIKLTVAVGGAA